MHIVLSEVVSHSLMLSSETTNCHAVSNCEKLFTFNVVEKFETVQNFELVNDH